MFERTGRMLAVRTRSGAVVYVHDLRRKFTGKKEGG